MVSRDHTCSWEEYTYTDDNGKKHYHCEAHYRDWCDKCNGNPYKCKSAFRKFLASLSEKEREKYLKKYADRLPPDPTDFKYRD